MNGPSRDISRRTAWVVPLLVAAFTFIAFVPTLSAGFVTWDDDRNFLTNLRYRGLGAAQLEWMWTTFHMGHYVPLSWMTLGLDYELWGMNAAGYHLTNLLLHVASAVVLYFVVRRVLTVTGAAGTDGRLLGLAAAVGTLVWSIHPLRVESVAWVTERRDVLSGLLYVSSILIYLRAVAQNEPMRRRYWLSVVVFACALLSKATAMTLPAVLAILNIYPLARLGGRAGWWGNSARRVYAELIPFGVLSSGAAILSIVALRPPDQLSAAAKLAVSSYSLVFYLWKTIVPVRLSPLYEMPQHVDAGSAVFIASGLAVVGLTLGAWTIRRRWPGVTTAWFAFLAIILPMLGIVQNGPQIAADRYTYHAAPALALLVAGAFALAMRRPSARTAVTSVAVVVLATLGGLTWNQTRVWHDSETLWSRVLRLDPQSSIAHVAFANLLVKQSKTQEALEHYQRGVALDPEYAEGHNNLGVLLAQQGRIADAVAEYQRALALKPAYDEAHDNWGIAMAAQGDLDAAIEHYRQALAINADNADAHTNWGNALVRAGQLDAAIAQYEASLAIKPDNADAQFNWGVALARQNQLAAAIDHFRLALAINPAYVEAREYLDRATQILEHPRTD